MNDLTQGERILMLVLTGITNFIYIPALYVIYKKELYMQFHIGLFTMLTSFLYHSLESVGWKSLYLSTGNWHRLDNIGSIMCMVGFFIYLMDNLYVKANGTYNSVHFSQTDLQLNLVFLFITLTMQTSHPWDLKNTIMPIVLAGILWALKMIFYRVGRYNRYYVIRGVLILGCAFFCFAKGLDDRNDYLRFWHGMWHCSVGISSFYLWQIVDKDREIKDPRVRKYCKQQRFSFFLVLKRLSCLHYLNAIKKEY